MKHYKILFYKNSNPCPTSGAYSSEIVKAENGTGAEKVFAKHFPDNKDSIFGIAQFQHNGPIEPDGEFEIYE